MLRGREAENPFQDSQALTLKVIPTNLRQNQKMEILKFLFEFGVVTVIIAAVAALKFLRN
jgi:hypothetical protein